MPTLPEDLLLLSIDERSGKIHQNGNALRFGLCGAVLDELMLEERLRLSRDRMEVTDSRPTGDELLDRALHRLAVDGQFQACRKRLGRLIGAMKDLRKGLLVRLASRGQLRVEEQEVLWLFTKTRYPVQDHGRVADLRQAVRMAIRGTTQPDARAAMLAALLAATGLDKRVLEPEERRQEKKRLKRLVADDPVVNAVRKRIADEEAAAQWLLSPGAPDRELPGEPITSGGARW